MREEQGSGHNRYQILSCQLGHSEGALTGDDDRGYNLSKQKQEQQTVAKFGVSSEYIHFLPYFLPRSFIIS
jgi:hypothetical protein